jgi:energy-coupling factor transport system substrate-specific component
MSSRLPHAGQRTAFVWCALAVFGAGAWAALDPERAGLSLLLAAGALVLLGLVWLEGGTTTAKELAVIGTLAGVAAAGRILFAPIPGVQPVTVIALVAGVALGARAGIGVGALAALASNFALGQGIWTPWQMLGWGLCGAVGAAAAPLLQRRLPLAVTACVLGFAFSALMDLWLWFSFYPHTWQALAATMARGFPFDVAHAAGNFVLALLVGSELRRVLDRSSARLRTDVIWEPLTSSSGMRGHPVPPPASSLAPGDAQGVRGL